MKNKLKDILLIMFIFLPLIITLISFNYLPDIIPAHYGFDGSVTRYGSKYETLINPIISIVICLSCYAFTRYSVKNDKYKNNTKVLYVTTAVLTLIFNAMTISFLISAFNIATNIYDVFSYKILYIALGITFIILGNYLPKCKSNNVIGIRTRLTLSNKEIWYKTHRFAGKIFIIYGLLLSISSLFIQSNMLTFAFIISILIVSIIVCIYPIKIAKSLKN